MHRNKLSALRILKRAAAGSVVAPEIPAPVAPTGKPEMGALQGNTSATAGHTPTTSQVAKSPVASTPATRVVPSSTGQPMPVKNNTKPSQAGNTATNMPSVNTLGVQKLAALKTAASPAFRGIKEANEISLDMKSPGGLLNKLFGGGETLARDDKGKPVVIDYGTDATPVGGPRFGDPSLRHSIDRDRTYPQRKASYSPDAPRYPGKTYGTPRHKELATQAQKPVHYGSARDRSTAESVTDPHLKLRMQRRKNQAAALNKESAFMGMNQPDTGGTEATQMPGQMPGQEQQQQQPLSPEVDETVRRKMQYKWRDKMQKIDHGKAKLDLQRELAQKEMQMEEQQLGQAEQLKAEQKSFDEQAKMQQQMAKAQSMMPQFPMGNQAMQQQPAVAQQQPGMARQMMPQPQVQKMASDDRQLLFRRILGCFSN